MACALIALSHSLRGEGSSFKAVSRALASVMAWLEGNGGLFHILLV